jgi:lipopolysaccharide transport system permease protein
MSATEMNGTVSAERGELPVRVYTPEPAIQHPAVMLRELWGDLKAGRELAWRLFVRDLSAQYRATWLGYFWAFVPPLVSSVTFIFLQSQGIVKIEGTGIPYAAFAMMGTLLWQTFVDAINAPLSAVTAARPMLAKINFPREAILVAALYTLLFNFAIRLALMVAVMAVWKVVPDGGLVMFPVAVCGLLACGFACGLMILPVGTLYGDVGRAVGIVAQFWMLLTPVVYPARTSGLAGWLATWNPISPVITTARESLTGQAFSHLGAFWAVSGVAVVVMVCGLIAFRLVMPRLIERMGG